MTSTAEIALWSASLGTYAVCLVAGLLNSLVTRSVAGLQSALSIAVGALFVGTASGMLAAFAPGIPAPALRVLILCTGPLAACVATLGLMHFLKAHQHDHFVQRGLQLIAGVSALSLLAVFWPNPTQALEAVAVVLSVCSFAAFWLVLRAALLGDRFAWPMVGACLAMVFAVMGLYGVALHVIDHNLPLQALAAIAAAAYLIGGVVAVWQRNTEYLRMRRALSMHREKDLLTQLWTGAALIKRVDQTIARARRNRKETAIFCVEIFNVPQLRQELGHNAIEQVIYSIAARVRQSVGASTEVGRYDDNSFVVIMESIKRPIALRAIGLRLAAAVRKPYMLNPYSTSPREFRADIGVGIARLPPTRDPRGSRFSRSLRTSRPNPVDTSYSFDSMSIAQEAMHEAAELAKKARGFASRAAILDAYSRKAKAVEEADLR
jgi:diguanylate cyclase (GGDEF)-like protein